MKYLHIVKHYIALIYDGGASNALYTKYIETPINLNKH